MLTTIRNMQLSDIPFVLSLEMELGLSSWGKLGYERELVEKEVILLIAGFDDDPVGFLSGRILVDEFELFTVAVSRESRRCGVGQMLLAGCFAALATRNIYRCFLEVRRENSPAIELYKKNGFEQLGVRRNYYQNPPDDALIMVKSAIIAAQPSE